MSLKTKVSDWDVRARNISLKPGFQVATFTSIFVLEKY